MTFQKQLVQQHKLTHKSTKDQLQEMELVLAEKELLLENMLQTMANHEAMAVCLEQQLAEHTLQLVSQKKSDSQQSTR